MNIWAFSCLYISYFVTVLNGSCTCPPVGLTWPDTKIFRCFWSVHQGRPKCIPISDALKPDFSVPIKDYSMTLDERATSVRRGRTSSFVSRQYAYWCTFGPAWSGSIQVWKDSTRLNFWFSTVRNYYGSCRIGHGLSPWSMA
jgi:hypothetical protein